MDSFVSEDHQMMLLLITIMVSFMYLVPSIHPGNGSSKVLVTILGRTMTTGRSSLTEPSNISPIALVNTCIDVGPAKIVGPLIEKLVG